MSIRIYPLPFSLCIGSPKDKNQIFPLGGQVMDEDNGIIDLHNDED